MLYKTLSIFFILLWVCTASANSQKSVLIKPVKVQTLEFFDKVNAIGQCKNDESRTYYANVAGKVDILYAKQGTKVKAGEIIIAIDKDLAANIKAKGQVTFNTAELSYSRDKALFAKGVISSDALEKSRVNFETAKLDLAKSLQTYDDMIIKAPFDGEIGVIKARMGDQPKVGDYLFSVTNSGLKSIFIEVPELLYGKVDGSTEVIITDANGITAKGVVTATSGYLSDSGTITIKIAAGEEAGFIHGSYVNVALILNKHKALGILEQAVLKNDQGNFVYKIIDGDTVKQLYIKLGIRTNNMIELLSDSLQEGDMIILEGLTKIQDGSKVEIE